MLKEEIQKQTNQALKDHDESKRTVLGSLLTSIKNKEIEKRTAESKKNPSMTTEELEKNSQLSDEAIIDVIASEIKKRKESIELFEKGGRIELAQKEKDEIEILKPYLPEQLSEEELRKIVKQAVEQVGAKEMKDMGKVVGLVMPQIKGKADGSAVSKIAGELIKGNN